jgi:integrase
MESHPRTKALKADQLKGELKGDLAVYEQVGLFQRSVNRNTAYRYRGALLRYQRFLAGNPPSLAATYEYLGSLRKNDFDPATLRVYRAALSGYHQFRGEELKFKVKVPETSAKYVPWDVIQKMLAMAAPKPHDELILRMMADAGLRRDEIVNLKLGNVEGNRLRFRGKGSKERTVPMTDELQIIVGKYSEGRPKEASLVELGEKGVYGLVKRYGALSGMPEITPHDLRRAFGTHLLNVTGNIRIVQELLGHSNVNTTQAYTAVTLDNMVEAIKRLNQPVEGSDKTANPPTKQGATTQIPPDYTETPHKLKIRELARKLADSINPAALWSEDFLRREPVEFKPGKYSFSLGAITIDKSRRIGVQIHEPGTGIAEPHLVQALYSHLSTSGSKYAQLVSEGGGLDGWTSDAGQYVESLLEFLKVITTEVKELDAKINFHDEVEPGLTKWFMLTV